MSIARSGVSWFLSSAVALGVSWLASLYFARALPNPTVVLGTYYVFETVVSFAQLVTNGGVNAAMVKRISEGEDEEEFVAAGAILTLCLLVLITVLAVAASGTLTDYFELGGASVVLLIGTVWASQVKATANAVLSGVSRVGRSGGVGLADSLGQVGVQVALVFLGFGLVGLLTGAFFGSLLAAALALYILPLDVARPEKRHFRSLVSYAKYRFVSGFTAKFYDNVDIIVISAFLGKSATGVYGIGFRFSLLLTVFSGAISRSSLPEISKHHTQGNQQRIEEILTDAIVYATFLSVPAFVGFAIIAEPLIVTIYTPVFTESALIAVVALAIQIPDGFRSVFKSTLNALDRPDATFRGGLVLVGTNLVLDLLLVPTVGVVGAVVASLVGIVLEAAYLGRLTFDELNLSWRALPLGPLAGELLAAVLMGGIVFLARRELGLPVIPELAVLIPLGIGTYFGLVLIISGAVRDRVLGLARDVLGV